MWIPCAMLHMDIQKHDLLHCWRRCSCWKQSKLSPDSELLCFSAALSLTQSLTSEATTSPGASAVVACSSSVFCLITSTANKSSLLSWRALLRSLVLRLLAFRSSLATRFRSALHRACSSLRRSMLRPRDSGRSGPTPPASAAARLARLVAVEVATVPFAADVLPTATNPEDEDELPVDIAPQQGPCLGLWHCLSCVCVQATSLLGIK